MIISLFFDGTNWNLQERNDVLDTVYYNTSDTLETKFKLLFKFLDKYSISKFERFLNEKDDDETINSIKKDLKVLLYNKRDIIKKTRKSISKS